MNKNESSCNDTQDDVIVLGVASIETQGGGVPSIEFLGEPAGSGISEE